LTLALVFGQQCANFTRIYTFEDFDINSFVAFKQRVPSTITFRRGWNGMRTQLRLTMNAQTLADAKNYLFQIIGGEVLTDPKAALTLQVVPPVEEKEASDASTMGSFLGLSFRAAATMAILSGQFVQNALAESMVRQTCRVSADIQVIMAPYYYDYLLATISGGALRVEADSYKFENNTGTLDVDVCLDTEVQATFFQSCDKILTSYGLGLSSAEDLQLTDAFLTFDSVVNPHQVCAFDQTKKLIDVGADEALRAFTCEWAGTPYSGSYCAGSYASFDFKAYAVQLQQSKTSPNYADLFKAVENLQSNFEKLGDAWSNFVAYWLLDKVCVNWKIDNVNCDVAGNGCPAEGDVCCVPGKGCIFPDETSGTCAGKDWSDPWGYAGKVVARRDLEERQTTLSGPACSGNHPLIGKPGVCLEKSVCTAKGGETRVGLCPTFGATILCCAGRGFNYQYQSAPGLCGPYAGQQTFSIQGNGGRTFTVTKILREHLVDPSAFAAAPTARDNTMTTTTACAFSKLRAAALQSGVNIKINSGFRTLARQQYFWNCYQTKSCNNGNLAARPGTSNHGVGIALDLNTASGGVYTWMTNNARKYGFVRTVPSETWHWEYRP
jgi:hypothetical protein